MQREERLNAKNWLRGKREEDKRDSGEGSIAPSKRSATKNKQLNHGAVIGCNSKGHGPSGHCCFEVNVYQDTC